MGKFNSQTPIYDETCIFSIAASFLGSKWIIIILVALIEGKKRNNELQKQIPTISPRMLSLTLKDLEAHGLITRTAYNKIPPRVEYSLTKFGASVVPVFQKLFDWALAHEAEIRSLVKTSSANRE